MSTTLELFWPLSSSQKEKRIEASTKLVTALVNFQAQFSPSASTTSLAADDVDAADTDALDKYNATDVAYSIRRLIRGLASPRESSRLGFAVALTALLSQLNTVTASQIISLVLDASETRGSMKGQEERDVLFARLFGLTAVVQSGLVTRNVTVVRENLNEPAASLEDFTRLVTELVALGERKSWMRESCWWPLTLALDALHSSDVPWRKEAVKATMQSIFVEYKFWTPERLALALKAQTLFPECKWKKLLCPPFKDPNVLATVNLPMVAKIVKDSYEDDTQQGPAPAGAWKPQLHFVWELILDGLLPLDGHAPQASLSEFFRIVVDETFFASTASPERKYWGFLIFQKVLLRIQTPDLPLLFTKNFMRSWVNHLSKSDRYLHKIAQHVALDLQKLVSKDARAGLALVLQLLGGHGNRQFDKITKTKTVESILASMDINSLMEYLDYLFGQLVEDNNKESSDEPTVSAKRIWVLDQLVALMRNGAVPKDDRFIETVLNFLVLHSFFSVKKGSEKSAISSLRYCPSPPVDDAFHEECRSRLLACLSDLIAHVPRFKPESRSKAAGTASDGELWISKVWSTKQALEKDKKHVGTLSEPDEALGTLSKRVWKVITRLKEVEDDRREQAKGAELLLLAGLLNHIVDPTDNGLETLEIALDSLTRMFSLSKTKAKSETGATNVTKPIDDVVSILIGYLERSTAYLRAVATQVFSLLSPAVEESTVNMILGQLVQLSSSEQKGDASSDTADSDQDDSESSDTQSDPSAEGDDGEGEAEASDSELRNRIEHALQSAGIGPVSSDQDSDESSSDEELMDDDQMLKLDEHLAEIFRTHQGDKPGRKAQINAHREATHFKNRALDLMEILIKKEPSRGYIPSLLVPLLELAMTTGPDERQLQVKASGILRSRLTKLKEIPNVDDLLRINSLLEQLHGMARKARAADVLSTISQCIVYVSRILLHHGQDAVVIDAYEASIRDFISRKGSSLNTAFFQEFIRRYPSTGWSMRLSLLELSKAPANGYRCCQVFMVIQELLNHVSSADHHEVVEFLPSFRQLLYETISKGCEGSPAITANQLKDILKVGLAAIRQSKRKEADPAILAKIWDIPSLHALSAKVETSSRFSSATGVHGLLRQMQSTIVPQDKHKVDVLGGAGEKRKAGGDDDEQDDNKKVRRKKVKKVKE